MQRTLMYLKKSGKPTTYAELKYVYTPWTDNGPPPEKIAAARGKFSHLKFWRVPHTVVPVSEVPENMYTFGKEGMALPISIFKDQPDPVIGPEWTYPGIYDMKKYSKAVSFEDLVTKKDRLNDERKTQPGEYVDTDEPLDYWERRQLRARTLHTLRVIQTRMMKASRYTWFPYSRKKGKKAKSRAETAAQRKAEQK
ncbi:hypothetical protein XU18_4351 [Perkinsela sp. CCAP 1560/4]|nr:hypothetical protein XU18_4351 [Perkinsela sp. CCAP 1560/4]|eukprot:KNH04384.1 hypothetical protein XU18_4351 [Perkinsela sp. CCAP 1560/4]